MSKDSGGHGSEKKGPRVWYHGSGDHDIQAFDPDKTKRGVYGRGVYVTRRKDIAEGYAGKAGKVYEVHVDTSRSLDLTTAEGQAEFKKLSEAELRKKYDVVRAPGQSVVLNAHAIRHADENPPPSKSINARGDTIPPPKPKGGK